MKRQEFLKTLEYNLSALPQKDLKERLGFYSEMLSDRMEDGLSEEEAVAAVGCPKEIAKQILAEYPLVKLVKEKISPKKRLKWWEIVLIVLTAPIWLAILISLFAAFLSIYVGAWSVIISLWSAFVSLITGTVSFIVSGVGFCLGSNLLSGFFLISAGFVCAGVSIFLHFTCKMATKGIIWLTKSFAFWIKGIFLKKEAADYEKL